MRQRLLRYLDPFLLGLVPLLAHVSQPNLLIILPVTLQNLLLVNSSISISTLLLCEDIFLLVCGEG